MVPAKAPVYARGRAEALYNYVQFSSPIFHHTAGDFPQHIHFSPHMKSSLPNVSYMVDPVTVIDL